MTEIEMKIVYPLMKSSRFYAVITLMTIAAVIAIAGNMLIVYLFTNMKKVARLTPHIFLTNLALCDLLLGLKLPIFFLVTLAKQDIWIFNDNTACILAGAFDSIAFRVVVAGTTAVAIDRYLAVIHALKYPKILPERRAFLIIFFVWTYCLIWGMLPVIINVVNGDVLYVFSVAHNMCTIDPVSPNHTHKGFIAADTVLNFLLPLLVMTFCYLNIARKVLSPRKMGSTIKKFMKAKSRSLKRKGLSSTINDYAVPKDSGVGIKVDNCGSVSSVSDEDDYIELPAVTKTLEVADGANQTPQPVTHSSAHAPSQTKEATIEDMYKKTGLSVHSPSVSRFGGDDEDRRSTPSRKSSWTEESAAAIKDGAKKMSTAVTSSVLQQLKRISQASTAFSKMSKYQQKIARTTMVVYFSFVLCFTPFTMSQIFILTNHGGPLSSGVQSFIFVSVCMVYFSACINVIIYGTMHRNIKATLRNLILTHS